jgi:hypothetical protein
MAPCRLWIAVLFGPLGCSAPVKPRPEPAPIAIAPSQVDVQPVVVIDPWSLDIERHPFWFRANLDAFRTLGVTPQDLPPGLLPSSGDLMLRGCGFDLAQDVRRIAGFVARDATYLWALTLNDSARAMDCEATQTGVVWRRDGSVVLLGHADRVRDARQALAKATPSTLDPEALLRVGKQSDEATYRLSLDGAESPLSLVARFNGRRDAAMRQGINEVLQNLAAQVAAEPKAESWAAAVQSARVEARGDSVVLQIALPLDDNLRAFLSTDTFHQLVDGKVSQCNRLIEIINAEQESLKNASGSDPAALDSLGDVLENTGEAVGAVRLRDPELKRLRNDYRTMAHDLAKASRQTAQALRGNDPNLAAIAAKKMSSFGGLESALVDDINRYCSGSADDTRSH